MHIFILSLITSMASAADLNDDGCEDVYFDANAACVATTAIIETGVTIGATATVDGRATIGTDTSLQADTFIGYGATLVGRVSASGARVVGEGTVIGRTAHIDADHDIGTDNVFGRSVDVGERLQTQDDVAIGYASIVGDDVTLQSGTTIGSLVDIGNNTQVSPNTIIARSVTIADSSSGATIAGVIGPHVTIGSNNALNDSVRIRKYATLGDDVTVLAGARIGRGAVIGDGVTVGANVRIESGAQVTATSTVPAGTLVRRGETYDDPAVNDVNPPGTLLIPSSAFTDPNPPSGWTQCFGFKNTIGDDISSDAMDGCFPINRLRLRMWDPSGNLIDDQFTEHGNNISAWPNRAYIASTSNPPTRLVAGLWINSANFFATTNNTDACGQAIGGSHPVLTTGNGGTGAIAPGHSDPTHELGLTCTGNDTPWVDYTIALYR